MTNMTNHPKDVFENFIFNLHTTDREKLEDVIQQKLTYDSSCCDFLLSKACQEGNTALIYFLLSKACQKNDMQVVSFLIEKGINVKVNFDSSLIICAIQHGSQEIARILIESGADVNAESYYGRRPLHLAVTNGQLDIVRLLLDRGADINAASIHDGTPLQLAAKKGQEEMVRLLLDRGDDIKGKSGREPLEWAAAEGHVKVVELLLDRGADINAQNHRGERLLYWPAKSGNVKRVKWLLDKGADVYVLNNQGKNVLELVGSSKVEMISLFCHYKGLLDLNKSSISSLLQKNVNKIIKHELNEPNNNMDGLKNLLEAFSNADNSAFCKDFLKKVKKHVQSRNFVPKLKLDLDNDTNIKKFLLARSKLEDLKKLFSSIESEQTDPYLESLSCIASKVYEKVNQYWEQVDKHIVDLGNKVIEPIYPLRRIAKTEAAKNIFELLGNDMTWLLTLRDHRKQLLANNQAEVATKKLKVDEGTEDNDHSGMSDIYDNLLTAVCPDVSLSTVGSGEVEECKVQG